MRILTRLLRRNKCESCKVKYICATSSKVTFTKHYKICPKCKKELDDWYTCTLISQKNCGRQYKLKCGCIFYDWELEEELVITSGFTTIATTSGDLSIAMNGVGIAFNEASSNLIKFANEMRKL